MKTVALLTLLVALYSWAQERDAELSNAIASADCRPSDNNERAIQTIVDGHVFCEKHQRVSFGMAPIQPLACPIEGACDHLASLK